MFFANVVTALFSLSASALLSNAAPLTERAEFNKLYVIFYDDVNFTGAVYSPSPISVNHCYDLPGPWESAAESLRIAPGYSCTFHAHAACSGPGVALTGDTASLPMTGNPPLYNNIKSFSCNEA